ncbi:MAG: substrate-binding domain-containing protein [Chryseolinea sp.]
MAHVTTNLKRNVYADRFRGYKQALADHDIPFDEHLLVINSLSEETSTEAAQMILKMDPIPDGIFAANDPAAVSCIRELKRAGIKIPEQIAVGGFNNDPFSRVIEPDLTTINYPGHEMGEAAVSTLIRRLDKQEGASLNTMVMRHQLIVRESSLRKK